MQSSNMISQYKTQSIITMSKGEQLVMLFNEALKNMHYGSLLLSENNYVASEKCCEKCRKIFNYLSSILNMDYEVSKELYELYYFLNQQIIKAKIKNDPTLIDEIVPIVETMRDTWIEAEKISRIQKK